MLCGHLLRRRCEYLFELPHRIFPSDYRLVKLFVMHIWVILRHHWPDGSDGSLRCGFLFNRIYDVYILSRRVLSSKQRPIELHELFCRLLFNRNGPNIQLYFNLYGGNVFRSRSKRVFKLFSWFLSSKHRPI